MSSEHAGTGQCQASGCIQFRFDDVAALAEGWDVVEGQLYCPSHKEEHARLALRKAEWTQVKESVTAKRIEENRKNAKLLLDTEKYQAWDEFQQNLAAYHRQHGKLAPRTLRTLNPASFAAITAKEGPIDVEAESERLFEAEKKADATMQWLMER